MARLLALLALLSLAQNLFAAEPVNLTVQEQFEQQKAEIIKDLDGGKVYKAISRSDKNQVIDALDRISNKLAEAGGTEGLSDQHMVEIFNDQELVNTLLTKAGDNSRRICSRTHQIGSHFKRTRCETVAQRQARHERDRLALDRLSHNPLQSAGPE